jgi:hypothetical protein
MAIKSYVQYYVVFVVQKGGKTIGPAKQDTNIQPMVGSPPKAASSTWLTL